MRSRGAAALTVLGASIFAIGCGSSSPHAQPRTTSKPRPRATHASVATAARQSTSVATTTIVPPTTAAPTTTPPTTPPTAPPVETPTTEAVPVPSAAPPALLVARLRAIGPARQVIAVAASGYGTGSATLTAYEREASGWKQVFGPWFADIGRNGVAPAGAKREGDGRTPSGVFGFDFMFGVNADPGVHFPFRRITGPNIVWDDDPASANYNAWVDRNTASAGTDPEPMDTTPSYLYGAVIAYNDARTPGLGSAMFLHVSHASPTSGCISLPEAELLEVLRWLDPARSPRIAIGTLAALTS